MQDPHKEIALPADQLALQVDRKNSKPPLNPTSTATRFVENIPFDSSDDNEDEDDVFEKEDEETLKEKYQRKKPKVGWRTIAERVTLVVILACLVTSLTAQPLKMRLLWGLPIWKWVLMVKVVFSGRLVSSWLVGLLAFLLIESNFILREKVVYFVYRLRKSVQNCIWLGLVLLAWYAMYNPEVEGSAHSHGFWKPVWRALIAVTIGAVIWLVKMIVMTVVSSSFYVDNFFDQMKVSVYQYVILEKLSDPPLLEEEYWFSRRIDMEKLWRLRRKNATAYKVKRLVSHVMHSRLFSTSRTVDRTTEDFNGTESYLTSELEARMCAKRIFKNVAKEGEKYIEEDDLLRFLDKDEINTFLLFIPGSTESRKIQKSAFRNWVVEVYQKRQNLARILNDAKTVMKKLHNLVNAILIVIIAVMSLLVMGVATMNLVIVVSSQFVLLAFIFGNTCKTIFESIIFVFALHPFDAGDRCVIDGVQMIVEEMNFLMTVFSRYDLMNEKIYYPNSELLTKPISNFNRRPQMGDLVEFDINDAASIGVSFVELKYAIKNYIESKPEYWYPEHHVVMKETEDVNKMKIVVYFTHTINYQNHIERLNRRSELVVELKKILEILQIK